ncbi:MAG: SDR family oxidoreductase [Thermaurantimonas sp.]|uniref:SDR family oxidoreductase n=1 Tax=Thermaurantimonas sp. TaxID=2681568 RepID=UPI00391BFB5E
MAEQIILTGHTRGIGAEVCKLLAASEKYDVVGIARSRSPIMGIRQFACDLSNSIETQKLCEKLKNENPKFLIVNAGGNSIKPAESYTVQEIERIYQLNLVSPAMIIRACLPALLRNEGHIIALGSFSALEVRRWNNYYGSAKAGLHHLAKNLFEQYRKQNLRVTLIVPDIVASDFYAHQDFQPDPSPLYSIPPTEVSQLVFDLIEKKTDYIPTEIVIRPQMFKLDRR